jgi:hypothetical protein
MPRPEKAMIQTGLQAREYKLLLKTDRFEGRCPGDAVGAFWEDDIKSIISRDLDRCANDEERHRGSFTPTAERLIRFWDTEKGLLARCDYFLRERTELTTNDKADVAQELTLKLRTSDLFIATAAAQRTGKTAHASFEEDIAPQEVTKFDERGSKRVILAKPPSIRSRFALSQKQIVTPPAPLKKLSAILKIFEGLEQHLQSISEAPVRRDAVLLPGPAMRERRFEGASVKLGSDIEAQFTFTLWYPAEILKVPRIAEISFKCPIPNGALPEEVARRALTLFTSMQRDLGKIVNLKESSKTALALPKLR